MNLQESNLINELFDRIAKNAPQQRDAEAERLIAEKVAANPQAPYVLTQSTIILQQAVTAAQARIAALEKQVSEAQQGGGFLSGVANLFGTPQSPAQPASPARPLSPPPIPQQAAPATFGGGSFLQNAAATAAGVAGGALLFQGIESLLGHGGGFGGGGFGSTSQVQPTEVINNYYSDNASPDQGADDSFSQMDNDSTYNVADNDDFSGGDGDFLGGGDDLI
jgi:hypothetical protein